MRGDLGFPDGARRCLEARETVCSLAASSPSLAADLPAACGDGPKAEGLARAEGLEPAAAEELAAVSARWRESEGEENGRDPNKS